MDMTVIQVRRQKIHRPKPEGFRDRAEGIRGGEERGLP